MMQKALCCTLLCLTVAGEDFLSRKSSISTRCLLQGWADNNHLGDILKATQDCFTRNAVQTDQGEVVLQGTLGVATGCVLSNLDQAWGWHPVLVGSGPDTGGPYDIYGVGSRVTMIAVETPSGHWQFMLRKGHSGLKAGSTNASHAPVSVHSHHRGDATQQQEADLIHFAESCFSKQDVDTSNLGSLQMTLGRNVDCVLQKCMETWGFKPHAPNSGSDTGGPYDVYGLGATVVGVESPSGKWEFVLQLKY
ncbi:Rnf130 [Symbiodinium natans]|uniref:Rnf130 protein n=1 Tax=Symbiodinium natans TaxID=878477 RepID=A0A812IYR5_9DINO|nr:Rnf130 [Symbiodinium natans]